MKLHDWTLFGHFLALRIVIIIPLTLFKHEAYANII
jgi:hypothetical protein